MEYMNDLSNELIDILEKKKQNLINILDYTKLQTIVIDAQDEQKLIEYLENKQKHIDNINLLDDSFVVKFNQLKKILGINSLDELSSTRVDEFKKLKLELNSIYHLIEQIFEIEKENSVKIKKEYADIKSKLKEINGEKKLNSAYIVKTTDLSGGAFFDKKK